MVIFLLFQLEVNTLDLPAQSFLIVPLQIFLGDGWTICKTVIAFFVAAIAIQATLWLIKIISETVVSASQLLLSRIISATQHKRSWTAK
ncbi:MAG: hypothetical protein V7K35_06185 [Nostoc sp.]|uniref:hypothetical protein n=1 Tax=Nostoc sp. TaxID=1180 RepID=UPI002FF7432E